MSSLAWMPTTQELQALKAIPDDGPVVIMSLLAYKPDGGAEVYGRYITAVIPMIEERGGRVVYSGRVAKPLVGDERWHAVALVEYPSLSVFVDMVTSPAYQTIHTNRDAGLERTAFSAIKMADLSTLTTQDIMGSKEL